MWYSPVKEGHCRAPEDISAGPPLHDQEESGGTRSASSGAGNTSAGAGMESSEAGHVSSEANSASSGTGRVSSEDGDYPDSFGHWNTISITGIAETLLAL